MDEVQGLIWGLDPVRWAGDQLGFAPDEAQDRVLRSGARRLILNCTRQWGKSTVTAARAVHQALFRDRSLSVVLSPSERQSGEFMRKAAEFVRRIGIRPRGDGTNDLSLLFPNGSRIVGLPGTEGTIRGYSAVSLLIIDEASRVPDSHYLAVMPMLAVGDGDLWLISTPWGRRGFFHDIWHRGGDEWMKVSVRATECARISASFLAEQRREMGDAAFRQEYLCEFVSDGNAVFDREMLMAAISPDVKSFWPNDAF